MGPDDDRGQGRAVAEAARRIVRAGEELLEIETSKITNVVEADAAGTLTRIVAPEGTTLPIGALLAVIAPPDTPAAEIDAFVAQFVVVEPADDAAEDATPVAPREFKARSARCAVWRWAAARCTGAAAARFRRRPEQPGCSISRHCAKAGGHGAGTAGARRSPARMWAPAMRRCSRDVIEAALAALESNACMSSDIRWAGRWRYRWRRGGRSASRR